MVIVVAFGAGEQVPFGDVGLPFPTAFLFGQGRFDLPGIWWTPEIAQAACLVAAN